MANLVPTLKQKFFDQNGDPLAGGKLWSFQAGTSTPLVTYKDAAEVSANTNPIILDANGECDIWIGANAYKFRLEDSLGVELWTVDGVIRLAPGEITEAMLADNSISTIKLKDNSVSTAKIQDNSVTSAKIPDGSITATKIPDGSLSLAKLSESTASIMFRSRSNASGRMSTDDGSANLYAIPLYPWTSPLKVGVLSENPAGNVCAVSWTPDGHGLIVGHAGGNGIKGYLRSGVKFVNNVFSSSIGTITGLAVAPNGKYIAVSMSDNAHIQLLDFWTVTTRYDYLEYPGYIDYGFHVSWSKDGSMIALCLDGDKWLEIYSLEDGHVTPIQNTLSGTTGNSISDVTALSTSNTYTDASLNAKITLINQRLKELAVKINAAFLAIASGKTISRLSSPVASEPAGVSRASDWSPDSRLLAVAHEASPYLTIYSCARTSGGPIFTKLVSPTDLPTGIAVAIAFSPDGKFLAVGHNMSPFLTIYSVAGDSFTKIANPTDLPPNTVTALAWSPNGKILAVGNVMDSPYITTYSRSGSTFTKLAALADTPPGAVKALEFSPTGELLAVGHNNSPYLSIYQTSYVMPTNPILASSEVINV